MTEPHRAVIARLSADFAAISQYMSRVSTDLTALDGLLSERPAPAPHPAPVYAGYPYRYVPPAVPYWPQHPPQYAAPPVTPRPPAIPPAPPRPPRERSDGWI